MTFAAPTPADLSTVADQIGRSPSRITGIAARCPAGHPSVVVNYPLQRRGGRLHPFPTLFWLTCPELVRQVSRLEMRGVIAELDRRLQGDSALAAALRRDHAAYVELRWRQLSAEDLRAVEAAQLDEVLRQRGIGGLSHWGSVKCLHLHFAHYLAAGNPLGEILAREYGVAPCHASG